MMLSDPLKRAVVGNQGEASAEEIRSEFENGPLEGETLLLDGGITTFTVEELATGIRGVRCPGHHAGSGQRPNQHRTRSCAGRTPQQSSAQQ